MTQLADLRPNPKNPRKTTPEKLSQLKKALMRFGDLGGFVFNVKTKLLVGGHQRASIFPKSKIEITRRYPEGTPTGTVAEGFVVIKGERHKYREVSWDQDTERAANIAANSHAGEWDEERLSEWMEDLSKSGFDLDMTMLDPTEREDFLGGGESETPSENTHEQEIIPERPKKPKTKVGDVIFLGEHMLMCGNSLGSKTLPTLLKKIKPDVVFTDPPYLHQMNGGCGGFGTRRKKMRQATMAMGLNDFKPAKFFEILKALDAPSVYCFGSKALILPYLQFFEKEGRLWDLLVMAKRNPMPTKSKKFISDIEWLFFSRKKASYFDDSLAYENYFRVRQSTVRAAEFGHPTEKRVEFIEPYIQISCPKDGVVLDLFGGAGSTLIACEKHQRRCFMIEIDPGFCDVIVKRWEDFTGKRAKRA